MKIPFTNIYFVNLLKGGPIFYKAKKFNELLVQQWRLIKILVLYGDIIKNDW